MTDEQVKAAFAEWYERIAYDDDMYPKAGTFDAFAAGAAFGAAQQREQDAKEIGDTWALKLRGGYGVLQEGIVATVDTSPIANAIRKEGTA